MRIIEISEITNNIKEMCIEASHFLPADIEAGLYQAFEAEQSYLGKQVLRQLLDNLRIAGEDKIPICQDTGMVVIFIEIGQEIRFEGGYIEEAIQAGVCQGYAEGYLRNSVVEDPLLRVNTGDNTPAVIHYDIIPGEIVNITVLPKGFGSENMSRLFMLKPSDGREGIIDAVLTTVKEAGPNACPPMTIGVGIGGTFEKCAILAKKALMRPINQWSDLTHIREMEEELLEKINLIGIGPAGFGGNTTALAVNIETFPTHIAGLPIAVNICCHVNRHCKRTI